MAKKAEPSHPAESVRVRKIEGGFIISRAGVTPRGKIYQREEFSAVKPGANVVAKGKSPPPRASAREVGFLNGRTAK